MGREDDEVLVSMTKLVQKPKSPPTLELTGVAIGISLEGVVK